MYSKLSGVGLIIILCLTVFISDGWAQSNSKDAKSDKKQELFDYSDTSKQATVEEAREVSGRGGDLLMPVSMQGVVNEEIEQTSNDEKELPIKPIGTNNNNSIKPKDL